MTAPRKWSTAETARTLVDDEVPIHYSEPKRSKKWFSSNVKHSHPYGRDAFDYEQKYPEDEPYTELGSNARVWRAYLDESFLHDAEMVQGWRDGLDVLLVFAGLFSAVVSTFVVQASQNLSIDYGKLSTSLLLQIAASGIQNSSSETSIEKQYSMSIDEFRASVLDTWVNALWYASLSLSLTTAATAVLTKQWIHQYMSVPSGSPRDRSRIRQFRYAGLQRYHVPAIVGLLPSMMHLSLAIFTLGLVVYLYPLNRVIAIMVGILELVTFLGYLSSNLLPVVDPQCPYQTPLAAYIYLIWAYVHSLVPTWAGSDIAASLTVAEEQAVGRQAHATDVSGLAWLVSISSNLSVRSVVLQALSALPLNSIPKFEELKPASLSILGECLCLRDECLRSISGSRLLLVEECREKYERLQRVCFRFYQSAGVGVHCLLEGISHDSTPCPEIIAPSICSQNPLSIVRASLIGPEKESVRHEALVWLHVVHNALSDDVLLSFQAGTEGGNFDIFLQLIEVFLDSGPSVDSPTLLTLNNLVFRPEVRSFSDTISIVDSPTSPSAHSPMTLREALRLMLPYVCEVIRFGLFPERLDEKTLTSRNATPSVFASDVQLQLLLDMTNSSVVRTISAYQMSSRPPAVSLMQRLAAAITRQLRANNDYSSHHHVFRIMLRQVVSYTGFVKIHWADCHAILSVVFEILDDGAVSPGEYLQWELDNVDLAKEIALQLREHSSLYIRM